MGSGGLFQFDYSGFGIRVSVFGFRVSGFGSRCSGIGFRALSGRGLVNLALEVGDLLVEELLLSVARLDLLLQHSDLAATRKSTPPQNRQLLLIK